MYLLNLREGGTHYIAVSFTGYATVDTAVTVAGKTKLNVCLKPAALLTPEVFVSATRAGDKAPFSYSSITADLLRRSNTGQDMPFLLALTPSLVETSESGTGLGYTGLRIRGTEGSRINVTVDGIPLNDAESQQVFWVDLPDLVSSVDNIQVQRGVGTSSNGAGAFGASVNILSQNPSSSPGAGAESGFGSFNTIRNTIRASTGLLNGRFAMDMRYSDIKSDGYIDRSFSDNNSARLNAMYRLPRTLIKANILLGRQKTGISWWGVPAELVETDRRYNPSGLYTNEDGMVVAYDNETDNYIQNHYSISLSSQLADKLTFSTSLHYTAGKGYYEEYREDRDFSDYGLPDDTVGSTVISNSDIIRQKHMINSFYGMVWSLSYKTSTTEIVAGGGANRYDGDHFGKIIWMGHPGKTIPGYEWYRNRGVKSEISFYAKINRRFSGIVSGFADLQYRFIDYRMTGFDDDLLDIGQTHRFGFFNPKGGLYFTVSEKSSAFISLAVAGREPTRSDFKEAKGDPEATPQPETLYDAETGFNYRSDRVNAGINMYFMWYRNQLIPTGELSDVGYPIMTNVAKSYRAGIELTGSLAASEKISFNGNLTVSINRIIDFVKYYLDYNTSDWSSEYKSLSPVDSDIAYSPSVTATAEAIFKATERLSVSLVTKYVGSQYFDNTMSSNRKLSPYSVTGLRAEYLYKLKKGPELNARFNINNLLNNMYISNGYGGFWYEDGIEKTWAYLFPQAGINYMLTLGAKF
jgi:iron complex outermembrane receptor protein